MRKETRSLLWTIAMSVSAYLTIVGYFAVRYDTLSTFLAHSPLLAFMIIPSLLLWLHKSGGWRRRLGMCLSLAVIAGIICLIFALIERSVWVNADSYPAWLASDPPASVTSSDGLHQICNDMLEYSERTNGLFARCGMFYFDGPVWEIPKGSLLEKDYQEIFGP